MPEHAAVPLAAPGTPIPWAGSSEVKLGAFDVSDFATLQGNMSPLGGTLGWSLLFVWATDFATVDGLTGAFEDSFPSSLTTVQDTVRIGKGLGGTNSKPYSLQTRGPFVAVFAEADGVPATPCAWSCAGTYDTFTHDNWSMLNGLLASFSFTDGTIGVGATIAPAHLYNPAGFGQPFQYEGPIAWGWFTDAIALNVMLLSIMGVDTAGNSVQLLRDAGPSPATTAGDNPWRSGTLIVPQDVGDLTITLTNNDTVVRRMQGYVAAV